MRPAAGGSCLCIETASLCGAPQRTQLFTDYLGWFPDRMPRQGPQEALGQS
jgi:hypothetical protein